jgi:luciferase family oxidoreductase group 1
MIPFSILDLCPIIVGGDATLAFRNTLDLAQHAERWGYKRYWLAEHHNMPGIASAATSVVIGHVAGGTSKIRVGSGGVMLPNHAPLVIAEQFGTLASLYPGRIELGIGRAPGTDPLAAHALRRHLTGGVDTFPQEVIELQSYFAPSTAEQKIRAVPGTGLQVPIWLLGSSLYSAQLAAALGLPFAFASHFAPAAMMQAIEIYREQFKPSEQLQKSYVMLGINVFAAETDAEARRLMTSLQMQFIALRRGTPGPLPPPVETLDGIWSPPEKAGVEQALACSAVGSPDSVRQWLKSFIEESQPDELICTAQIYDHAARLRSFEITAELRGSL